MRLVNLHIPEWFRGKVDFLFTPGFRNMIKPADSHQEEWNKVFLKFIEYVLQFKNTGSKSLSALLLVIKSYQEKGQPDKFISAPSGKLFDNIF